MTSEADSLVAETSPKGYEVTEGIYTCLVPNCPIREKLNDETEMIKHWRSCHFRERRDGFKCTERECTVVLNSVVEATKHMKNVHDYSDEDIKATFFPARLTPNKRYTSPKGRTAPPRVDFPIPRKIERRAERSRATVTVGSDTESDRDEESAGKRRRTSKFSFENTKRRRVSSPSPTLDKVSRKIKERKKAGRNEKSEVDEENKENRREEATDRKQERE